ncbi:C40 family peptidase [Mycetocola reblochoni]|uniref:C40 family peptidase n=1 Tax=Mycetocola reblochoni TaxID=331618 RepID=UPI001FE2E5A3|nr:C40 family peptidase [Mycetocola reblochoni]
MNPNTHGDVLPTRRSLRPLAHSRSVSRPHESTTAVAPTATKARRTGPTKTTRRIRSTAILALVVPGLVATVGLPAVAAFNSPEDSQVGASLVQTLKESGTQTLSVSGDVEAQEVDVDTYSATTREELAATAAQEEADAAAERRAEAAAEQETAETEYESATVLASDTENTVALNDDTSYQSQLFAEALKYQGVPYVFGGATPAGFDCSGFVKYVYAKFGVSLPHSSTAQGAMGTTIPLSEAVPGDLLVAPGHIGFYAGNGQILHASQPGVPLRIGGMYQDYHAVRLPIG